jgi:flagellar protein FliS
MSRSATQKYQAQQVVSASPAKLVAMLYDKAISCLQEAIRAIEAGEIEARWRANDRAMAIIAHLWMTLDREQGGEIAANLEKLYRFMLARLPEVDLHNNPGPARDAIHLLEPLRRSWHTLADQVETAPQPAANEAASPLANDQKPRSQAETQAGIALLA